MIKLKQNSNINDEIITFENLRTKLKSNSKLSLKIKF